MAAPHSLDPAQLAEQLASASPDVLREMVTAMANALMSAQVDLRDSRMSRTPVTSGDRRAQMLEHDHRRVAAVLYLIFRQVLGLVLLLAPRPPLRGGAVTELPHADPRRHDRSLFAASMHEGGLDGSGNTITRFRGFSHRGGLALCGGPVELRD